MDKALRNPRLLAGALALSLPLAPAAAVAADAPSEHTSFRGVPIPVPLEAPHRRPAAAPAAMAPGVVFVNFDGAQLSWGWDDASTNTTQIWELAGTFSPYGDDPVKRAAVMQAVGEDWAPYAVTITDTRPIEGEYTMCMVGPTNPFGANILGIAPLDCGDSQTHGNITYAFHTATDGMSATTTATTIGQEIAHSYGLEHVDDPTDVMNPYNNGGNPWFHDECLPIVGVPICGAQHEAGCGSTTLQNDHAELMALFGPAAPDTEAPTVTIVAPMHGDVFEVGADFDIDVEASDDRGVAEVRLYLGDVLRGTDFHAPLGWHVTDAPAGEYVFVVEAVDLAGNRGLSAPVVVQVGAEPEAPDPEPPDADDGPDAPDADDRPDDPDTSGDDDGDGSEDDASSEVPVEPEDPGFSDKEPYGLACAVDPARSGSALFMLLPLGLSLGRRRRASRGASRSQQAPCSLVPCTSPLDSACCSFTASATKSAVQRCATSARRSSGG